MNLYKIDPSLSFLDILADFILTNFKADSSINNLKVILPNGMSCWHLQNILINKQNIAILPNIIPFSHMGPEGEQVFTINSKNIKPITFLQEKIILAQIVNNYYKSEFNIIQSLQLSSTISELFHDLACHNLSIESVHDIEKGYTSEHWDNIYNFLKYTHQALQEKITSLQLSDRVAYQRTVITAEISRLSNTDNSLIVAGIIGSNPISRNFLKEVVNLSNGFLILPPISNSFILEDNNSSDKNCLYNLENLLTILDKKISDFQSIGKLQIQNTILDKIIEKASYITPKANDKSIDYIKYFELEDIYQEAEQISHICQQYCDKKIAIIVDNQEIKNCYTNSLVKYSLEFQDLLGDDLSQTSISSLIITISRILCHDFDNKSLFLLLKNPLINSRLVQKLELLLSGKNRFVREYHQILSLVEQTKDDELIEWCKKLIKLLYKHGSNNNLNYTDILKLSIKIAEKLYPDIWYEHSAKMLSEVLSILLTRDNINGNLMINTDNKKYFPDLLKSLISNFKYYANYTNNNDRANIIIAKPEDLILLKFDLVILANFNQGSWVKSSSTNKLINEQALKQLNIPTNSFIDQYYFYLFLHNPEVIITRAKRQERNSCLMPSNLLLKLQFILQKNLLAKNLVEITNYDTIGSGTHNHSTYSPIFPEIISVTDIEMLIRNPYAFYAKKILHLTTKDTLWQEPKISEFGSFVHRVLQQYTTNYDKLDKNKVKSILEISSDVLHSITIPAYTQKIWQVKFQAMVNAFIEFDEQRRLNCKEIYPECRGELSLNIAGNKLTIVSIADRIEIDKSGNAAIIDYKTGTLPTKKDVELGLSPQLIIESLILQQGGFGMQAHNVKQAIYVKIANSKPVIQALEINLTQAELDQHKQGMIQLLEYYIINKNFAHDIDLLKYDYYAHLARRNS